MRVTDVRTAVPASCVVRRSRALLCSFEQGDIICHRLGSGDSFAVDPSVLRILALCEDWATLARVAEQLGLSAAAFEPIAAGLVEAGLLEDARAPAAWPDLAAALENGWKLFELAAHRGTRHTERSPRAEATAREPLPVRYALPPPHRLDVPLDECLRARRSHRRFAARALTIDEVATLLGRTAAPSGIVSAEEALEAVEVTGADRSPVGRPRYPHPTAGALDALRVLLAVGRVEGLPEGLYRYEPSAHRLDGICPVGLAEFSAAALPGLEWVGSAALVAVILGDVAPLRAHYRHPYLLTLIEAGHMIQNVLLAATALGLAACELGSVEEDAIFRWTGATAYEQVPLGAVVLGARGEPYACR